MKEINKRADSTFEFLGLEGKYFIWFIGCVVVAMFLLVIISSNTNNFFIILLPPFGIALLGYRCCMYLKNDVGSEAIDRFIHLSAREREKKCLSDDRNPFESLKEDSGLKFK